MFDAATAADAENVGDGHHADHHRAGDDDLLDFVDGRRPPEEDPDDDEGDARKQNGRRLTDDDSREWSDVISASAVAASSRAARTFGVDVVVYADIAGDQFGTRFLLSTSPRRDLAIFVHERRRRDCDEEQERDESLEDQFQHRRDRRHLRRHHSVDEGQRSDGRDTLEVVRKIPNGACRAADDTEVADEAADGRLAVSGPRPDGNVATVGDLAL